MLSDTCDPLWPRLDHDRPRSPPRRLCARRPPLSIADISRFRRRKALTRSRKRHLPATEMTVARKPHKTLRLVHTSDVHLESDTFGTGARGDEFRDRVRRAFTGVIDLANSRESDLLLIVGDLFDSSRVPEDA